MMSDPRDDQQTGEARFLAALPVIEQVIAFLCQRNHLRPEEIEDFSSHVTLRLIEHDYAILGKFEGRSSLRTFLSVVVQRLLLDYRTSQWGKWRPSAEARRLGPVAIELEQLLTRDGHRFEEACELVIGRHRGTVGRSDLERYAAAIPARTRRRFESDEVLEGQPAAGPSPSDDVTLAAQHDESVTLATLMNRLIRQLATEDRLIMTLHFHDGRTVADIAAILRRDQKQLYRHIDKLLRVLKRELEASGIDAASAIQLFATRDLAFDWDESAQRRAENRPDGPSLETGWGSGS
jgi:RNA polymerase sigma factor (sigma-70 family)